jgi:long-chain acyl-CoA synthetase
MRPNRRLTEVARWSEDLIPVDAARTLDGLFVQRVQRSPRRVAYQRVVSGGSDFQSLTWEQIGREVVRWQRALALEGLQPGERVALLLRNCPEWVMFDQAALGNGLVTVPLYTDDRADNAAFILRDAAVRLLLIQDVGRWKRLAPALRHQDCPVRVVILDPSPEAHRTAADDPRVVVAEHWLPAGGGPLKQRTGDAHALASIVYTSGTTGRPKGVMLSHHNMLSVAHACLTTLDVYQQDLFLSFLPLSHTLERTAGYYLPMMAGAQVAYARSVAQLGEDLQRVRPSVLIAVPRVFERVYQRMRDQMQRRPPPVRWLFAAAVRVGWRRFEHLQGRAGWHPALLSWPLLRRLVADKVVQRLGGRVRAAVSGGAALSPLVARQFLGLGVPLLQGYGLTETSPVVSVNTFEANDPASVGVPIRGVQVRIGVDSELQVKGPGVMLGYWNNHAATAHVIDADGWLHTGDQARIAERHIYITGRLKDILVLSNGEKVPPDDMEMAIALDPLFEQVVVVGEGRPYLAVLVVLNSELWPGLAREYGLDPDEILSLRHQGLIGDMLGRVRNALRDFPGYAKIRRLGLLLEPWTVDNGLLTPTLKVKRAQVLAQYAAQVASLYAEGPA